MATVTLVDTSPSVRQLERALQATCGALVTEDVTEVRVQVVQAIDAIRAALAELRPARNAPPGALAFGFIVADSPGDYERASRLS
ncbi:MAG: hypothetical protein QOF83_3559 [Solirubrobacteraceae bacterium]|jgi:hypothetical protein|nr:hypothetical protein [Solirubrobacteraceae bacterium]